ncbi:MAG: hypothetical protein EOM66_10525 [Clostridia bacterium]|nr:hypothetical protein [Clostridia bacterium]
MNEYQSIDQYIASCPEAIQPVLQAIRQIIREEAPQAEERIRYGIPTFYEHENLIHFAAAKKHIGLYPTPGGIEAFAPRLTPYRASKGAIQFPLNQPIPYDLIREIAAYRVRVVREKLRDATAPSDNRDSAHSPHGGR